MDMSALRNIGLHENEIRIYLALLEHDEISASEIAQKTNINRTLVYHFVSKLIRKGLVSHVIKNNVKFFRATDPRKLIDFMKEMEGGVRSVIPYLMKMKKPRQNTPYIEVYEGFEGVKTLLNDVLHTRPKEWLDITPAISHAFIPDFMNNWEKQRERQGIKGRILIDMTPLGMKRAHYLKRFRLLKVKYMPKDTFSPATIWIYAHKVAITLWSKDYPVGILVENKEISERFKGFFNWLWQTAKP